MADVWVKKTVEEPMRGTGEQPITVRWVDVNKGDDECLEYSPPLEWLRLILSLPASNLEGEPEHVRDPKSEMRTQISLLDISRAYLCATCDPDDPTYVMLLDEDPDSALGMCAPPLKHLYASEKPPTHGSASTRAN